MDKGFFALVTRLAFGLYKLFTSVCLHFRVFLKSMLLKSMLALSENFLRLSTVTPRYPHGLPWHARTSARKTSRSSSEVSLGQGILQMHLRGEITRKLSCRLSASPSTQSMVSHRHKTCLSSGLFLSLLLLKSKVKVLIARVLRSHYSQFLLYSESSISSAIPDGVAKFLESCVIHQDLVEHVDDQKRFREYSYSLVYFAAFQLRG